MNCNEAQTAMRVVELERQRYELRVENIAIYLYHAWIKQAIKEGHIKQWCELDCLGQQHWKNQARLAILATGVHP